MKSRKNLMSSQFPRPTMACRRCGKVWDTHGKYCNPILDRLFLVVITLLGLLVLILMFSLMYFLAIG
jgi:hypothetical protein